MGNKVSIQVKDNKEAQKVAFLVRAVGLGEKNSAIGAGLCHVFTRIKVFRDFYLICYKVYILYNHLDGFPYIINIKRYTQRGGKYELFYFKYFNRSNGFYNKQDK